MRELNTQIEFDGTPEEVWKIFTDLPAHTQWNPFITKIDVNADGTFQPGVPRPLFLMPLLTRGDVSPDGKRFLQISPEGSNAPSPFIVVSNWQAGLK